MRWLTLLSSLLVLTIGTAAERTAVLKTWEVDGQTRQALVVHPDKSTGPAPVVLVFHGHGGSMKNAYSKMAVHPHWPEAVVVYPQGLPTPGKLTDPEGKKSGWQSAAGEQNDRDLKFVDAILLSLKKERAIDTNKIFATGHSNGGGFTYTLWAARPQTFAAFAPSAAVPGREFKDLKPKPVFHIAGEQDDLVKYSWQQFTIERLKKLNGVDSTGKKLGQYVQEYSSEKGPPVRVLIHPGNHAYPSFAPKEIVAFFQGLTTK